MSTLDPVVSGESNVPASKYPNSRSVCNRRHQLAIWLLLGSGTSGLLHCEATQADGLQWTDSLQLTEPVSEIRAHSTGKAATPIHNGEIKNSTVRWDRIQTPASAESNQTRKTPSIRPTESVNSVLGIRDGFVSDGSPLSGTSIQLMAPKKPTVPAAREPSMTSASSEIATPQVKVRSFSPPQMVTRDNASIRGYRETWRPSVPSFNPHQDEIVLLGPVRNPTPDESESRIASLGTPASDGEQTNELRPEGSVAIPSNPSDADGIMVGNRQYYPSFIKAKVEEAEAAIADSISRARSPLPDELTLEQPSTSRIIGSGLPKTPLGTKTPLGPEAAPGPEAPLGTEALVGIQKALEAKPETTLAPVDGMPVFEKRTASIDDAIGNAIDESETPKRLDAKSSQPDSQIQNPTSPESMVSGQRGDGQEMGILPTRERHATNEKKTARVASPVTASDRDGTNEGQGEGSEDSGDVAMPNELTMELLLEEADTLEPIPDRDALADSMTEVDDESPALSSMTIKPLNPPPPKEVLEVIAPQLESVDSDVSLRNIHDEIESLQAAPISQLDATGRVKQHAGAAAFEQLSPSAIRLKTPILQTLRMFHARTEHADSRSNWGMMHQIMVYGTDTRIIARNRNYSAIAWLAGNNVCRGSRLMTTSRGKVQVRDGTGLQGHQAQFLAVMSLVGVPSDYPLYVGNQRFKIKDLVEVEAAACKEGEELTFTLIGLSHYLDTETTWTGVGGESWDFERLIAAELSQPIVGAACGGTHRLMCFAHALRKRRLEGQPIDGQWKRAEDFLDDFVQYTYSLQNRDGSMSTDWFESREDNGDLKRKVQTTGHMVEFLLTHLPDQDLNDQRITRAITFLNSAMRRIEIDDSAVGYRGHALRSLAMYYRRMYGEAADYPAPSMTNQRRVQRRR